jgi:hypothetical protein
VRDWLHRYQDVLVGIGSAFGTFLLVVLLWQGPKIWLGEPSALTVLGRQKGRNGEPPGWLNLPVTTLARATLDGADLRGALLFKADLRRRGNAKAL